MTSAGVPSDSPPLLDAALAWAQAGVCVLPAAADGTKRPALPWQQYQHQRPNVVDLTTWLGSTTYDGIGIVCGAVSGNLEMFELEGAAVHDGLHLRLRELFTIAGFPELWMKLQTYVEISPAGGLHWIYRVAGEVPGNTKLARRRHDGTIQVLMETRGEGGWVICAPSAGRTHASGRRWQTLPGSVPGDIPTLTTDEHQTLHRLAATFNTLEVAAPADPKPPMERKPGEKTPGDEFIERTDWADLLIPAGWIRVGQRAEITYWRRPGKNIGISASTGYGDGDWLYVFTTSTEFESERTYTKLGAYAALHHHGDYAAAARELRRKGFGTPQRPQERFNPLTLIQGEGERVQEARTVSQGDPGRVESPSADARPKPRKIILTDAPTKIKPVQWVWADRLPLGCLSLLAGREGIGKSVIAYDLAARITRGVLHGRWYGTPRTVIICATEDSWAHTITPRLMAAGADLTRVKLAAVQADDTESYFLVLPEDIAALEAAIAERGDVALLLLDPLISRLDASLDTYKDADVRKALEPLVALGDRTSVGILGLIHVNKGGGNDPLNALMASRAFSAVARAVAFAIVDRDDPTIRLLGCPKNNLGRDDLPSLRYSIEGIKVGHTDEGDVFAPKLVWGEEDERSVADVLADNNEHRGGDHSALQEAMDWLTDYLTENGGLQASRDVKEAAKKAQHTEPTLKRAAKRIKVEISQVGFPRVTFWNLPGSQPDPTTKQDQNGSGISRARGATTIDPTTTIDAQPCRPEALFPVGSDNQDQVIPPVGSESSGINGSGHARAGANWTDSEPQ